MEKPNFRDPEYWEELACKKNGHHKVVEKLREIIKSEYQLELGKFSNSWKEKVWIMKKTSTRKGKRIKKPSRIDYCVPHVPDIVIEYSHSLNSWVYLDYVNTKGKDWSNLVRDYRGLIALEAVMRVKKRRYRRFVIAVRDRIFKESDSKASIEWADYVKFKIERLPLTYVIKLLEENRLQDDYYDVQCMRNARMPRKSRHKTSICL